MSAAGKPMQGRSPGLGGDGSWQDELHWEGGNWVRSSGRRGNQPHGYLGEAYSSKGNRKYKSPRVNMCLQSLVWLEWSGWEGKERAVSHMWGCNWELDQAGCFGNVNRTHNLRLCQCFSSLHNQAWGLPPTPFPSHTHVLREYVVTTFCRNSSDYKQLSEGMAVCRCMSRLWGDSLFSGSSPLSSLFLIPGVALSTLSYNYLSTCLSSSQLWTPLGQEIHSLL